MQVLSGALLLVIALPASAQTELLTNGALDSFTSGAPTGWNYQQNSGPSNTEDTSHTSPFTNVYPAATASFLYNTPTGTSIGQPFLSQTFAGVANLDYSFDFDISTSRNHGLLVPFYGRGGFEPAEVFIDNSNDKLQVFAQNGLESASYFLSTGTWYQVSGQLNVNANVFSLNIQPAGGSVTNLGSWELFPYDQTSNTDVVDEVAIYGSYASGTQTDSVNFNNFSVVAAPEPCYVWLLACALVVLCSVNQLRNCNALAKAKQGSPRQGSAQGDDRRGGSCRNCLREQSGSD